MIQSISAPRAAAIAEAIGQPIAARGEASTSAGQVPPVHAGRQFMAGMEHAMNAQLPAPELVPTALSTAALAPGEPTESPGQPVSDEAEQALTPEQWLLAMLDQQLAAIEARDGQPLAGAAVLASAEAGAATQQPVSLAEPEQALQHLGKALRPAEAGRPVATGSEAAAVMPRLPEPGLVTQQASPMQAAMQRVTDAELEQPRSAAERIEVGEPLVAADRGQALQPGAADRGLKLQGTEAKWGEQMLMALRENVELQVQQKIQSASIRLDPPELGSLEILLSHESGRLNVHLSAANGDVARLLQQTSDRLRQELVGQHFVQVNVQVGAEGGGQHGQQRPRAALPAEDAPMAARAEAQADSPGGGQRVRDVLITV